MCGIVTLFGEKRDVPTGLLSHRGPDDYRTETMGKCRMDFYRLAINDLTDAGMQPFVRPHRMFVCNGEIYNHRSLRNGEDNQVVSFSGQEWDGQADDLKYRDLLEFNLKTK